MVKEPQRPNMEFVKEDYNPFKLIKEILRGKNKMINRKFLSENIMSSKEAADYIGISKQRLNVLVNEGRIKYLKKNKHCYVFTKAELDIYKNPTEKDKILIEEQIEMYKSQFIGEEGEFKSLYNSSAFCIEINGNNKFKDEIMNLIEKVYFDGLRRK